MGLRQTWEMGPMGVQAKARVQSVGVFAAGWEPATWQPRGEQHAGATLSSTPGRRHLRLHCH